MFSLKTKRRWVTFSTVFCFIYCEFLADFFVLWSCTWPQPPTVGSQDIAANLNVMLLADTHLLGPVRGHWLDKLYREWHMRRAFQTSVLLHKPDVIFVLGDLFDEGDMVDHDDFNEFVRRFRSHFHAPAPIPVISAVGNHDVGFHYKMHSFFVDRFEQQFNNTGVELYTIKGNHFVFINSMAMENDGCDFCESAILKLHNIAGKLNCLKDPKRCKDKLTLALHKRYSPPIVLQHFPTYQRSTKSCIEHDFPTVENYNPKWDVLSKNATKLIGTILNPRLAFAGHSHHYCYFKNLWGVDEYTIASFSWRNKIDPSFLMASVNPSSYAVLKCNMLRQETVNYAYVAVTFIWALLIICDLVLLTRRKILKSKNSIKQH